MRGHLKEISPGKWRIVVYAGRGLDGREKRKTYTVEGARKAAEKRLREILNDLDAGLLSDSGKQTLGQFLERWLEDCVQPAKKASTHRIYTCQVRKHLVPALGHVPLNKLSPGQIQSAYAAALRRGLSRGSVRLQHAVLRQALEQAVKWQLIPRNPADNVDQPAPGRYRPRPLTEEETAILLQTAEGTNLYVPILIAVTMGLRCGEIVALRWQDIDMERGLLTVNHGMSWNGQAWALADPKSHHSRRPLPMPSLVLDALRRLKAEQAQRRLLMGDVYQDGGYVLDHGNGRPLAPYVIGNRFCVHIKQHGLPRTRFHDLRHSHATQLLGMGVQPKVVSERLGHSSVAFTLGTYGHILPRHQAEASEKIDAAIRKAMGER